MCHQCLYTIKVNGQTSDWFKPSQGYDKETHSHLTCSFFVWKFFSGKLTLTANTPKSGLHCKIHPRTPIIPALLFTDDCLLFYKGTATTCMTLKKEIDSFCRQMSGQLVNFHKSTIIFFQSHHQS